jgi:outer membrane protein assembly factor BamB
LNRSHVGLFLALSFALALVAVVSCGKNHAANAPTVPAGRDSCFTDSTYTFTTIATDPDGDSVAVRFDWGDSAMSNWSVLVPSGDTVAFTHAWPYAGTYEVRAQARDKELLSSDWSAALAVLVVVARPGPHAPAKPDGPARGEQNTEYTFATVAFHPESMNVAIRFAWGDGDTSDWSAFVAPGESVSMIHKWPVPDTYAVAAQAKDTGNATSQWSDPHPIRIWPPDTLRLWRVKLNAIEGDRFYSSPAFGPDGNIYVGSPDGALYSLRTDSTLRWRYATGERIRSSPAIATDGTIYVGSDDNVLYAVNSDGTNRWTYATDGSVQTSPAIGADGTIYVASLDQWLHAVNPEDGSRKWRTLANRTGRSSAAVAASGVIYVGTDDGYICAESTNGAGKWEYKTGGAIHSSPSFAADGTVYCGSDDGYLYAVNPDGSLKWKFVTDSTVQGSASIASDGTVYFGSDDGYLYALNPVGSLKWKYLTGGSVSVSPTIASDGTIYFGSSDYSVYALNPGGTAKWQFETDGAIQSSPTIGPDGKVYFTSKDGYLYALKGTSPLASSPWPKFHHDLRNTGRAGGGR